MGQFPKAALGALLGSLLAFNVVQQIRSYDDFRVYPTNFEEVKALLKNDRPVIGTLTMQIKGKHVLDNIPEAQNMTYVAASFVKLMEAGGARVVPLLETMSNKKVKQLLTKINGLIMPGGDINLVQSGYERIARIAYKYAIKVYDEGGYFPIIGICRGAQMLMTITAGKDFLSDTDSLNQSIPLDLTEEAGESRLFGNASEGVMRTLREEPCTFNAHVHGLPTEVVYNDTKLQSFYRVISTNVDRKGESYVSTYEGRKYPMYGLQWHPEKVLFVWNPILSIDHSIDSIMVAQYVVNFFINEARKSTNRFDTREEEEKYLIYKRKTTYIGNITESPYEQIYLFPISAHPLS